MRHLFCRWLMLPWLLATSLACGAYAEDGGATLAAECAARKDTAIDGIAVEQIAGECARYPDGRMCRLLGRRHTRPRTIFEVVNYLQFNAPGLDGAPTSQQAWVDAAPQKYDMFIDDYYSGHCAFDPAPVHAFQDSRPPRGRLAIAYIDGGEFMRCCSNIDLDRQSTWFDANGNLTSDAPAWLGPQNPKFPGLYTARVWMPAWRHYILRELDKIMALGYDGAFIDVLYNDGAWGTNGFAAGQAGIPDYQRAIVDFARAIWEHVKQGPHPDFILIANFSGAFNDDIPAITEGPDYSDAFMRESFYYLNGQPKTKFVNGKQVIVPIAEYFAQENAIFLSTMAKHYRVILMQDYNLNFDQQSAMLTQTSLYNLLEFSTHKPINLIFDDRLASCKRNVGCWVLNPSTERCELFSHDTPYKPRDIDIRYCRVDVPSGQGQDDAQ